MLEDPQQCHVGLLEQRVSALEGELRRTRRRGAALVLGAVVLITTSFVAQEGGDNPNATEDPGPNPTGQNDELVLMDDEGRKRVWLGVLPTGECGLGLYDDSGTARAEFFVGTKGETRLLFTDRAGVSRAFMGVAESGHPTLRLANSRGNPEVEAGLMADGSARIRVKGPNPNSSGVTLRRLADGRPGLDIDGDDGRTRASIGVSAQGAPGLRLRDNAGKTIFERP